MNKLKVAFSNDSELERNMLEESGSSDPLESYYNSAVGGGRLILKDEAKLKETGDFEIPDVNEYIQGDRKYLNDTLRIQGLFKEFRAISNTQEHDNNKMKTAVDGLSLSIYKNQILALLGHNGAGKTTTISMLTGSVKPNKGMARAFGIDVFEERDFINQIIGICPQEDVIIDNMTVVENLQYFCSFRRMTNQEIEKYIEEMLP